VLLAFDCGCKIDAIISRKGLFYMVLHRVKSKEGGYTAMRLDLSKSSHKNEAISMQPTRLKKVIYIVSLHHSAFEGST
jgi:hypothetical protein